MYATAPINASTLDDLRCDADHDPLPDHGSESICAGDVDATEPESLSWDDEEPLMLRWVMGHARTRLGDGVEFSATSWHLTFSDSDSDSLETECSIAVVPPFVTKTSAAIRAHSLICMTCRKAAARYLDGVAARYLDEVPDTMHWPGSDWL